MKIVVFGAAGWLGRAVLANLEGRHAVRAFDQSPAAWETWADVGGNVYALTKRLQEEMCRSFHDAFGMRLTVLCPDYIVDSRIGLGRFREKLGPEGSPYRNGWVCRHDLGEACRLALESETIDFDIFHIAGTPEADATCNVARSREVLGLVYRGDLDQYR